MSEEMLEGLAVVLTTMPQEKSAEIAKALIDRRLAACATITGVRSIYRWKGAVCDEEEALVILKTTPGKVHPLISGIRELHPYEVPEILALPVTGGYLPYFHWVEEETGTKDLQSHGKDA